MVARSAQIVRHELGESRLELARREVPPEISDAVLDYTGYVEHSNGLLRRRELPNPSVVVILELGPPITIYDRGVPTKPGGFVAGLCDTPVLTEHDGSQSGVQISFSPTGARLFLGVPMSELENRVLSLDEVLDGEARRDLSRLRELSDWDSRLDLVDRCIARRIAQARAATGIASWAHDRIVQSGGRIDVGELAKDTGYSHKHLISLFRDVIGVTPKQLARLVRFDRVVRYLRAGGRAGFSKIAAEFGYSDHAHLSRDFRDLMQCTPSEARAALAPAEVNFVQAGASSGG
jgi:AraC-like DNA-binding protein